MQRLLQILCNPVTDLIAQITEHQWRYDELRVVAQCLSCLARHERAVDQRAGSGLVLQRCSSRLSRCCFDSDKASRTP